MNVGLVISSLTCSHSTYDPACEACQAMVATIKEKTEQLRSLQRTTTEPIRLVVTFPEGYYIAADHLALLLQEDKPQ